MEETVEPRHPELEVTVRFGNTAKANRGLVVTALMQADHEESAVELIRRVAEGGNEAHWAQHASRLVKLHWTV